MVIVNAVTNAIELMESPNVTVVLTGGVVRPTTLGAVGDLALATLGELHVDQIFLAINNISIDGGLMYPSFEEVAVKRAMIAAASEVVLLADRSKFGHDSLVRVAPVDALTRIVTSAGMRSGDLGRAARDRDRRDPRAGRPGGRRGQGVMTGPHRPADAAQGRTTPPHADPLGMEFDRGCTIFPYRAARTGPHPETDLQRRGLCRPSTRHPPQFEELTMPHTNSPTQISQVVLERATDHARQITIRDRPPAGGASGRHGAAAGTEGEAGPDGRGGNGPG